MLSLPLRERHPPLSVAVYPMLAGGIAIFPVACSFPWKPSPMARVSTGACGGLRSTRSFSPPRSGSPRGRGGRRGVASRVLVYQYLVTLIGASAGILLLGEGFGPEKILGAVILLAGVYLARSK